jgi:hypothetical protein
VSLADKPEHKALVESFAKYLPPVGSSASDGGKKPKGSGKPKPAVKSAAPADEDRGARFDRLYPGKTKLTPDEYLAKQSDKEAAKERFKKFDADKDGFVSREEFITGGGKNPNAK